MFRKSSAKRSSLSNSKSNVVSQFQERLAEQGEQILATSISAKIAELDEICSQDIWNINRIGEICEKTKTDYEQFLKDSEQEEEDDPLTQLFKTHLKNSSTNVTGKQSVLNNKIDSKDEIAKNNKRAKILLSSLKLAENNAINLKFSLELEQPNVQEDVTVTKLTASESIKSIADTNEPPAKKSKHVDNNEKSESLPKESGEASEMKMVKGNETTENKQKDKKEYPVLKSHPMILDLVKIIKPQVDEISDWCVTLRSWLLSAMVRNKNIGGADLNTEIQATMVEEIKGVEDEFAGYKEEISAYFLTKATLLEKALKAPELEDLKTFIIDNDEKMFLTLRSSMFSLRNQLCNLYDAILKDTDRLFPTVDATRDVGYSMY